MRCVPVWLLSGVMLLPAGVARAEPECPPLGGSAIETAVQALQAVRAQARRCGDRIWPAAAPLVAEPHLAGAAQRYAEELARRDRIDHVGEAGASLRRRLHEAGYVLRQAAENLAGGPESLDEALAQWLASPTHCENLMAPEFREFGLACATGPGRLQRYWVLQLAEPVAPLAVRSSPDRSP